MKVVPPSRTRRAISGVLAGIILFAMLFTVGMGFFTYQNNLTSQYNHANSIAQQSLQAKVSEASSILAYPNRAGSTLNISAVVSNVGANFVNITALFVEDQTGRIACFTPPIGGVTDCRPYYGHTSTRLTLPKTILNIGGAANATTDIRSTDPSVASCSTKTPCFVGVITSRGNVFTGLYPGPIVSLPVTIATTLNSTLLSVGGHVHDTSLLSGVSSNAGGTVKYYYFGDGVCSTGQTLVSTQTVTNGVVPNSDNGFPSGTQFSSVGSYSWEAVYSGDAHNSGSTSACEPLSVFSTSSCIPSANNFCFATLSQGFGSIAFDFNSFRWFNSGACNVGSGVTIGQNPTTACTFKGGLAGSSGAGFVKAAPLAYTISQTGLTNAGTNLGFSMNITNADPAKRTLVLDQFTQIWFSWFCPEILGGNGPCAPGPHGQIATTYYGLVNMTKPYPTNPSKAAAPGVTIKYGQTATLFFGIQSSVTGTAAGIPLCGFSGSVGLTSQITPVFIFFHGTIGGNSYGEDFPLAAVLWTDIGGSC
jgi:hypothetical protein